jgi:hypothetical protein
VWLHDTIPLYFKFFGGHSPLINRQWIEVLTLSANSGRGLLLSAEPDAVSDALLSELTDLR